MFAVHGSAAMRKPRRTGRRHLVSVATVHPEVMARARWLAGGDVTRLEILGPDAVIVWNGPKRPRGRRPPDSVA
jgi:hypothetical protein